MSLTIRRINKNIRLHYSDGERVFEILINVTQGITTILNQQNVNISIEAPSIKEERIEQIKPSIAENLGELREKIRRELSEILKIEGAVNNSKALTLDDIIEIAQLRKNDYPAINEMIRVYGISKAKKLIALIIGSMKRRGIVKGIEVAIGKRKFKKYYLLRT